MIIIYLYYSPDKAVFIRVDIVDDETIYNANLTSYSSLHLQYELSVTH